MTRALARLLLALGLALAAAGVAGAQSRPSLAKTEHVEARLVADVAAVAPGGTVHVALIQTIIPGWHTYWRNPGDSGEETRIAWTLPQGARAGAIVWPRPSIYRIGPLANYGYSDQVVLTTPIVAPAGARAGETLSITAQATWLVCKDICIPEEATLSIALPVADAAAPEPRWGARIAEALAAAPRPADLPARFTSADGALTLSVHGPGLAAAQAAYFFPYSGTLIDHAAPQALRVGARGLSLVLTPPAVAGPLGAGPVEGLLTYEAGGREEAVLIRADIAAPLADTAARAVAAPAAEPARPGLSWPLALAFAALGGLILNLMPCVFPVLSIKALGLAHAAHGAAATARRHGLVFLLGVMATFLALAGGLLALQAAGQAVGWGFQLQSPPVVIALGVVMFLIGLNLLGAFEVGGRLSGAGQTLAGKGGDAGAFFTGALAVVVASPCTAPFMGGALAYAATQPPAVALSVFAALGLGFAAPFTALSFAPGLMKALPRPGPWMERLKQAFAFPMFAAAVWLAWVVTVQAGATGALAALAAMLAAGFAVWLFGVTRPTPAGAAWRAAGVALAAAILIWGALAARPVTREAAPAGAALAAQAWSAERLDALRADGRAVFVNFTAAWCVTCKVNEAAALRDRGVAAAFAQTGTAYLEADWTNRDAAIAAELAAHGRNGVPLYLYYPADGGPPQVLPQILTPQIVIEAVR